MDDLISRQAARKKIEEECLVEYHNDEEMIFRKDVLSVLRELPSVTPARPENLKEDRKESQKYCAECYHAEMCSWYPYDGCEWLMTDRETRPKGKWIEDAKTYYEELNKRGLMVDEYTPYFTDDIACSRCLAKFNIIDNETQFFKFCPNCGEDMR